MFQRTSQVNMSRQEAAQTLKTERLLVQVRRALSALEEHVNAVNGNDAREKHGTNVALVAQCNLLNAQASLAVARKDKKGLALGMAEVAEHESKVQEKLSVDENVSGILGNYYGYMTSLLSGKRTQPLPSVQVCADQEFERTGNGVFENLLGGLHDAGERTRRMEEGAENIRARQDEQYERIREWESGRSDYYDASAMTGHMAGRVAGYSQNKIGNACASFGVVNEDDVGSYLMGHDSAMSDVASRGRRSIMRGDSVHVRGEQGVFEVFRVDTDNEIVYIVVGEESGGARIESVNLQNVALV